MASAVSPQRQAAARGEAAGGQQAADVLVVFGITGDLAKVMTLRSLYRLERRGLLDCPVVGPDACDRLVAGHGRWHAPWTP
jgi:glucose-6-phosphate 1-dehydrogenase